MADKTVENTTKIILPPMSGKKGGTAPMVEKPGVKDSTPITSSTSNIVNNSSNEELVKCLMEKMNKMEQALEKGGTNHRSRHSYTSSESSDGGESPDSGEDTRTYHHDGVENTENAPVAVEDLFTPAQSSPGAFSVFSTPSWW